MSSPNGETRVQLLPPAAGGAVSEDLAREISAHLDQVLASPGFRQAPRLHSFLRYVVEHTLRGASSGIKEATIGVEVYGKEPGYDSRADSSVRVEASKLRQRLTEYYDGEGTAPGVIETVVGAGQ
ncbi:MAG: hypothetical protein FJW31_08365 [Acidobacteria bacterium]|nr:hypothetical protein [Acidobacteriota bacterium]